MMIVVVFQACDFVGIRYNLVDMEIERPQSSQPIPADAKLVFKGKIFSVYQWQQKMFGGSYQTFEKLKRADTVMIIPATVDKKIILIDEEQPGKKPFVGAPGGRVDEEEDILRAAERELLEETGYKASKLILWDSVQPISKIDWAVYTFIAKGCTKVQDPSLDLGEKIRLRSLDLEQFLALVSQSQFQDREIILKLLREGFKLPGGKLEVSKLRELFFG